MKSKEVKTVAIKTEFIRLDALLKLAGLCVTGGHAKMVIQNGEVRVDGEICLMRGKKIRPGETVSFQGTLVEVKAAA